MVLQRLLLGAALSISSVVANPGSCLMPLSCHNTTAISDTCRSVYPGGQLLLTQFWDTNPSTGPNNSWTVHGLWPDNCDGTYEQNCDKSRAYTNITAILKESDPCTLDFMEEYWKDYQGDDESFWEHEFGKHGTCISTLEPRCYPDYEPTQEVVDYFRRATTLFQTLPSYDWLATAGIFPSTTLTYTLATIQYALTAHHGQNVIINCNRNSELNELWYHYNVRGLVQSGKFIPVEPVGAPSTCPKSGIKYLPKYSTPTSTSSFKTATRTSSSTSTATRSSVPSGVLSGKGYLFVDTPSTASGGFLISRGSWYRDNGGTPAIYTATPDADGKTFTLNSSKGKCAVLSDSSLSCDTSISTASSFAWDGAHMILEGSSTLFATEVPTGQAQGVVYTSPRAISLQITWNPLA
ncbi:ribonuclease T2 [Trichoderma novae-zelandiae]